MSNTRHLTGLERNQLIRLAQMVSCLNDELANEDLGDPVIIRTVIAGAMPELTRKAFDKWS